MVFVRADQLRIEQVQDRFPFHALDFSWEGFEPTLTCEDLLRGTVEELDLEEVRFAVSRRRTCVGYFDGGKHFKCPKNAPVEKFSQCADCAGESFIPFQDCIFNPRCDGEICDLDFCRREHVLYIAFYDTRAKIGLSSTRRVESRLIEQGADAYALVGTFETRRKAREMEKQISSRLRVPQFFRQDLLLEQLGRPVDDEGIRARYEGLGATLEEVFGLLPGPLRRITGYPIDLPLRAAPKLQDTWGAHRGELVGIKGRWLVYECEGLKVLDLGDLPSRLISRELR